MSFIEEKIPGEQYLVYTRVTPPSFYLQHLNQTAGDKLEISAHQSAQSGSSASTTFGPRRQHTCMCMVGEQLTFHHNSAITASAVRVLTLFSIVISCDGKVVGIITIAGDCRHGMSLLY